METLDERYKSKIIGKLSCFDRIVIKGTVPEICYAQGMTGYLYKKKIRIFDYAQFAEPFTKQIRDHATEIAEEHNIKIEFIRKSSTRKEDLIKRKIKERGEQEGLVHILSAMESCSTYEPWHDKASGKTFLRGSANKCLHYYFYFIDKVWGLCYVRVPTWLPFQLQIYCNGHNWLCHQLDKKGIEYSLLDNALNEVENPEKIQKISDSFNVRKLHEAMDKWATLYCPVIQSFNQKYHWSIMQCEYATDIIFKKQEDLQTIYSEIIATAIHTVKADNIATFLGQKLTSQTTSEIGNNYNIRIEGTRIKHNFDKASIKMYDKHSKILRIETTLNDLSKFKHYRSVEHTDGSTSIKWTAMKKNIYSLQPLQDLLKAANQRYLNFISCIEDRHVGKKNLEKLTRNVKYEERTYKGFNFFNPTDEELLLNINRGEFKIKGFSVKDIRFLYKSVSKYWLSRSMRRLRLVGLIKKVKGTYKYYITKFGELVICTCAKIKSLFIIPQLDYIKN
jgi:hypothetical protein